MNMLYFCNPEIKKGTYRNVLQKLNVGSFINRVILSRIVNFSVEDMNENQHVIKFRNRALISMKKGVSYIHNLCIFDARRQKQFKTELFALLCLCYSIVKEWIV